MPSLHGSARSVECKVCVEFALRFARLELLVKSATQIQTAWRRRVQMGKYKAQLAQLITSKDSMDSKRGKVTDNIT